MAQQTFLFIVGKALVLLITFTVALICSSVKLSHDAVTVISHAQHQDLN